MGLIPANIKKQIAFYISKSRLTLPVLIAALVGSITGLVIVGFVIAIDFSHHFFFGTLLDSLKLLGKYAVLVIPAIGGVLVGVFVFNLAPEAKGHGVPEVMKAIVLRGGKIRPIAVLMKIIASVVSIGSGASVGREGPAVQIGAGLGSNIGRLFRLGESRIKNLIACGSAAGIAAVFNAPITGVMFALEVILKDFGARTLSTVVVASVSGSIVSRIFLGESPAFTVPHYSLWHPMELVLYAVLGFLAAFIALLFIVTLDKSEGFFDKSKWPAWTKPVLGGLMVGCLGLYFPQVFGMGFESIESALHGNFTWHLLLILVLIKILATALSLGSGSSGGTFAPTLFTGAMLGGAVGHLFFQKMPFPVAPPGAYALVGMASVFSGAFHAPVTAILLVFEMTGDYQMILPIMIASVIATSVAQLFSRNSIDTVKLVRQGLDIGALEEVKVLGAIQVRDAMTDKFCLISTKMPAQELVKTMSEKKGMTFFLVNKDERLVGVIHPEEIQEVLLEKNLGGFVADDFGSPLPDSCFPDESLSEVSRFMMIQKLTEVPVVDPEDPKKAVGVLKSDDVFGAYMRATLHRNELMSRLEQEDTHVSGTFPVRFIISEHSELAGKAIRELTIPDGVVLTSIESKKQISIPDGKTILKDKDKVWAVVLPQFEEEFRKWLKAHKIKRVQFLKD